MWKKAYKVLALIIFILSACQKIPAIQATSLAASSPALTISPTSISPAESPSTSITPTISEAFLALLATETPVIAPTCATPCPGTGTPRAAEIESVTTKDLDRIKKLIQEYFDRRYFAFSLSNQDGIPDDYFADLFSETQETSEFITLELAKMKLSLEHAKLNHLQYSAYEYYLDFEKISQNEFNQKVTVIVSKRENIIFEISALFTSGEPIMSSGSGEKHTILLQQEEGEWKIISDTYNDYLWRMLRRSDPDKDELLDTLESGLSEMQSAPLPSSYDCFRGEISSREMTYYPEPEGTPCSGSGDTALLIAPSIEHLFVNGKIYDPAWPHSNPFINLYLEPDGNSPLRFVLELEGISTDQFLSCDSDPIILGWQILIYPHLEELTAELPPAFGLDLNQKICCDSRPALFTETTIEAVQESLGDFRVFDYQVINGQGEIQIEHSLYLNPPGEYLISDAYGEVTRLGGGVIGYPNLMGESKAVFPHLGKVIRIREPRGGFYQLQFYAKPSIQWYKGLWTYETPSEIIIEIYPFREDGAYDPEQAFSIPENRLIKGRNDFDLVVAFTYQELIDAFGQVSAFYVRFLDQEGSLVGEDYLYILP